MKTGAVITAAGMSSRMKKFKPMLSIGDSTIIKRVITTLKQAGCDYIVVVTGYKSEQLERHISDMDVICLHNKYFAETQMLDSVKIGLEYIRDKCERVLFTPADIPMFSVQSVIKLLSTTEDIACPVYKGKRGHPLLISSGIIPTVLAYEGHDGLRGAIKFSNKIVIEIPVDDPGVLLDADTPENYRKLLSFERTLNKQDSTKCNIQIRMCRESVSLDPELRSL